jgi:ribonuclease HI
MRVALKDFLKYPTPFTNITKHVRPPRVAEVQTDGSFNPTNYCISRTAVILNTVKNENFTRCTTYLDHENSHESEWRSVFDGIEFSMIKDQGAIELENDCLSVVNSIIKKPKFMKSLYKDYYVAIQQLVRHMDYVGIRWIPREMNKADELFRV